jgi:hypothetical protein
MSASCLGTTPDGELRIADFGCEDRLRGSAIPGVHEAEVIEPAELLGTESSALSEKSKLEEWFVWLVWRAG